MSRSEQISDALCRLISGSAMIQEHYPELADVPELISTKSLQIVVTEAPIGSCSSCFEIIAQQGVGRRMVWPKYCPNCGKRKQDVGGTCTRPVYA